MTKSSRCFRILTDVSGSVSEVPELSSQHREADPKIAHHAVYAASGGSDVCVVADDTDVYVLLLFVSAECDGHLYFRQGTALSKDLITYHSINAPGRYSWCRRCTSLPAFHVLTGSDFTQPFFGRSKYRSFKKMRQNPETISLLSSLSSADADLDQVIYFVLHVIYNRPKKEKTPGDSVMQ